MAANDAELLLKVGLDLGHFRGQLNRLGSELAGQAINLNVKFNRSGIASELTALQRQLGNKTFRVEVATNLEAEIKNADRLVKALQRVQTAATGARGASPIGTGQLGRTAGQGGFSAAQIRSLFGAAIQGGLLDERTLGRTRGQMVAALGSIGRDSIEGLLNGLNSGDAKLQAAAKSLGDSLIAALKDALGIASPSKETGKLGKFAAEGFEKGFVSGMVKAERQMAAAVRSSVIGALREGLANLPGLGGALIGFERQLAASVQLAVRRAMREGLAASIAPGAKGGLLGGTGGAATGAAVGGAKALGGGIAGGVAKLTAGGLMGTAANLARYSMDSSAYQEFVGRLYQEIINSALSTGTQGAIIGALAVGGVAGGVGFARGATGSLAVQAITAIRNRILASLLAVSSGELNSVVKVMVRDVTSALFQGAIRQLRAASAQLPAINWPAVVPPSGRATTPTTMALPPGQAFAGLPGSAFGAQKRLIGDILDPSLKEILRNAANAFVDAVRQGMNNAVRSVVVRDLGTLGRPMLGGGRVAGLLPAGVGRVASPYATGALGRDGETRAEMLARREREARMRSALRNVAPSAHFTERPRLPGTTFMGDDFVSGGGRDRVRGVGQPPQRGGALALAGGPSTKLPEGYFENVKKYNAALEIARATSAKFTESQIPLIGGLKEVAGEFGFAIKQVLLFGTAYKGLAFVTSLPGQILNAAKSQQQYNNALQTATQDTGTFAKELLYVDNVQRAFGLNLETTRTGFTRLYASMAPTGFDSGSIEKLFTGISAATAALQLTPDKAERVIYAFGQMASKGQIMSEELKGQLGDVLPGALAIFAKAAGMSVKEFSKAMEDGVFVGGKFREVFAKVSDELMTRFGTGAQAAGKSLQGLLNTVGGDFQRTLESFAPLANIAAQAVLTPLGNALRQLSTSAQIAMGEMERVQGQLGAARQDVSSLRAGGASASQIKAAEQNVAALEARYRTLNEALKDPAVAKQVKDLQLLVQELSKAGTFVMNVAKTIGEMLAPALNFLGTNLTSVIATITAFYIGFQTARLAAMALMGVLLLYRGLSALLGFGAAAQQATALAGAFNVLGVAATRATTQMVGLRLALTALVASTVIGAVVGGIVMIAGAFATMSDKAKDAAQSSRDAAKAAIDAAKAGNVAGAAMSVQTVLAESRKAAAARKALEGIYARATPEQKRGAAPVTITSRESVALQGTALTSGMIRAGVSRGGARQIRVPSGPEMRTLGGQFGNLAGQQAIDLREAKEAARQAEEVNKRLGLNKPMPGPAAPETPSGGGTKETAKGKDDARRLAEEIARQAMAASDALFSERQRLLIMQQTNPIAKAFAQYTSQELIIQRELNQALKEAKGDKEKADLRETARLKQSANALELEQEMKRAREDALAPIEDLIKGQREQLRYEEDVKNLLQQGMLPERAKQVAEVRKLVRTQLESLDLSIKNARAAITEAEARGASADQIERLKKALEDLEKARGGIEDKGKEAEAGVPPSKEAKSPLDYIKEGAASAQEELAKLTNWGYQAVEGAKAIGSAFGQAFKDIASGSMSAQEALANMMQSIADHFLDMAAQIIAQQITMMIYGMILKALGVTGGGLGSMGGGGGFGSFDASGGFGIGGMDLPGLGGAGALSPAGMYSGVKFANGGIASGGFVPFKAFASGGMVAGPTLGLVGEGKYNEAIVPLPDGRSIPVQLQDSSIRDKMGDSMSSMGGMPMLSMSFQSTTINGVEYVDRAQLEAAMAETRKISVREGATRGATIALDKLANSPSSRRRVGLR